MSTKTTIKRVALVAAVALTLGGFSAVSASAANSYIFVKTADGVTGGTLASATAASGNGVAGPANFVQIGLTTADNGIITVSGASSTILSASDTSVVVASGGASASTASSAAGASINVSTPAVGTVTVNYYKNLSAGVYASTATESVVITVNATASNGVYSAAKSTVFIVAGNDNAVATADASAITVRADTTSVAATIQVTYLDALGAAMPQESISATISGPGTVSGSGDTATSGSVVTNQYSIATNFLSANGAVNFKVWANKQVGLSTITIKNSTGVVLGTKTLTFSGTTAATVTAKAAINYISASTAKTIAVTVKDSAGNPIPGYSVTGAAATGNATATITSPATTDSTGVAYFTVAPVAGKSGAATFDFADSTGLIKSSATTNVSGAVAAALTITPDAATAEAGQKITYTLSATDANGLPLADGVYTFFAAKPVVSAALGSNPFDTTTVTLVDGKATSTAYAPAAGKIVVSWTLVGTLASATASGPVGAALVGTTVSAEVVVSGSADSALAVDAANAATDAANAAAEEASNATEAASEALAAVNSLATTVASLIAGIKAQLTSLTALIKKIQAKVKA